LGFAGGWKDAPRWRWLRVKIETVPTLVAAASAASIDDDRIDRRSDRSTKKRSLTIGFSHFRIYPTYWARRATNEATSAIRVVIRSGHWDIPWPVGGLESSRAPTRDLVISSAGRQ
jgi:hypothetical protein